MFETTPKKASNTKHLSNQSWQKEFDKTVLVLIELLFASILNSIIGTCQLISLGFRYKRSATIISTIILLITILTTFNYNYISIANNFDPSFFNKKVLYFLTKYHWSYHWLILNGLVLIVLGSIIGFALSTIQGRYKRIFIDVGLKNGSGQVPKLIRKTKLDRHRVQYEFDAKGIAISAFRNKTEDIEAWLKVRVDNIAHGKDQSRIILTTNSRDFPRQITFHEIQKDAPLPPESFYIGFSRTKGILTQKVASMPHMLISGATGTGKSCFFRQALLSLLKSTPHLELYLIDLKGGIEMIDFVDAPNTTIIKTIPNAISALKQIENRMKKRFDYLQAKRLKQILPERDNKNRIILAIDEASVLYAKRDKLDDNYQNAIEARKLTDSIAKLSRVAAINLFLATQKMEAAVIPTSVSENISARMAFRANSLYGSQNVIRSKDAADLPEIPGRGIWIFGTQQEQIQTPWVDEKEVVKWCKGMNKSHIPENKQEENPAPQKANSQNILQQ